MCLVEREVRQHGAFALVRQRQGGDLFSLEEQPFAILCVAVVFLAAMLHERLEIQIAFATQLADARCFDACLSGNRGGLCCSCNEVRRARTLYFVVRHISASREDVWHALVDLQTPLGQGKEMRMEDG